MGNMQTKGFVGGILRSTFMNIYSSRWALKPKYTQTHTFMNMCNARRNSYFLSLVFLLFVLSTYTSVTGVEDISGQCYPCNDYNRKWESIMCENATTDCGDCYPGYASLSNLAECTPQSNKVIGDNETATILKGSDVVLKCQWDRIDDCVWMRNENEVLLDRRYQQHLRTTKECSLSIKDFQEIDVGDWSCQIFDDLVSNVPTYVTHSWLYLREPKLLPLKEGEEGLVPIGQSVVLACYFNKEVDCMWTRLEDLVEISSRYRYVDPIRKGQKTTECSLRIDDLQESDVGKWQCQTASNPTHEKKQFIEVQTPVKPAKQTANILPKQTVTLGKPVALKCGYDVSVNCGWERDGRPVAIADHYRYVMEENGRNTRNCTLEISSLDHADLGEWRCGYKYKQMTHYKMMSSSSLQVAPEVNIMEYSNAQPLKDVVFMCTAKRAFPAAVVYWQLDEKKHVFDAETIEENGMFTTNAAIDVRFKDVHALVCIIQHPSFVHPRVLKPQEPQVTPSGSVGLRTNIVLIFMLLIYLKIFNRWLMV